MFLRKLICPTLLKDILSVSVLLGTYASNNKSILKFQKTSCARVYNNFIA